MRETSEKTTLLSTGNTDSDCWTSAQNCLQFFCHYRHVIDPDLSKEKLEKAITQAKTATTIGEWSGGILFAGGIVLAMFCNPALGICPIISGPTISLGSCIHKKHLTANAEIILNPPEIPTL